MLSTGKPSGDAYAIMPSHEAAAAAAAALHGRAMKKEGRDMVVEVTVARRMELYSALSRPPQLGACEAALLLLLRLL